MDLETTESKQASLYPLHAAVKDSNFSRVCDLLEDLCYNVNSVDDKKDTPLHIAAEVESLDILEFLLRKGASINSINNQGDTPLHKAAKSTMSEMVLKLLERGASVNIYNLEGYTPFHIAVIKGYKKVIEPMLDRDAKVQSRTNGYQTPLHLAAVHWNCILAEILLDRGANINVKDYEGSTPLHVAVSRVDLTMTELLLERGANINVADNSGQTPLHIAANHWNCRIVKTLLDRGALVNAQNNSGFTALHIATINGDLTLVNRLLERGALIDVTDKLHLTPLQYAVCNDHAKLVYKLLSEGADVNVLYKELVSTSTLDDRPQTKQLLLPYILKLQIAGLCKLEQIKTESLCDSLIKKRCIEELKKMKDKKAVDTLSGCEFSLFNVLDGQKVLNGNFYKLFENLLSSPNLGNEYPQYSDILKVFFLRIKKRILFVKKCHMFFSILHNYFRNTYPGLPPRVREKILSRLNYVDLQNLLAVIENIVQNKISIPFG